MLLEELNCYRVLISLTCSNHYCISYLHNFSHWIIFYSPLKIYYFGAKNNCFFNPFATNVPPLYPLKTSENLGFSDPFRGSRSGTLVENGLIGSFLLFFEGQWKVFNIQMLQPGNNFSLVTEIFQFLWQVSFTSLELPNFELLHHNLQFKSQYFSSSSS